MTFATDFSGGNDNLSLAAWQGLGYDANSVSGGSPFSGTPALANAASFAITGAAATAGKTGGPCGAIGWDRPYRDEFLVAIALVQKSTVGEFAGTISAACTLTGVTSGNTLLLLVSHANFDATGGGVTASDAQGAYSADQEIEGSRYSCDILRLSLANAGTHLATLQRSFGTGANSYGQAILTECQGFPL